jgi:Family of unknown function (DUF5824)
MTKRVTVTEKRSKRKTGNRKTGNRKTGKRKTGNRKTGKKQRLWPPKYYRGLTKKQALERKKEIERFGAMDWKDPRAYVGFKTDRYARTKRRSTYTMEWNRLFPEAKTLTERSQVTGVPVRYLKDVFRKALAAWRSGHRPGATQQQWTYPRVSSFLLCGKTHYTAHAAIVRRAKKTSAKARKWFKRCKTAKFAN